MFSSVSNPNENMNIPNKNETHEQYETNQNDLTIEYLVSFLLGIFMFSSVSNPNDCNKYVFELAYSYT